MNEVIVLDAGPLGMISHPRATDAVMTWFRLVLQRGCAVCIPEIADYEIRRELLRAGKSKSVVRLDELKSSLIFLPITTAAMLRAAEFWADARRDGQPTASNESLDADVILAGQVATMRSHQAIVATTNPRHIGRFVRAANWQDITVK